MGGYYSLFSDDDCAPRIPLELIFFEFALGEGCFAFGLFVFFDFEAGVAYLALELVAFFVLFAPGGSWAKAWTALNTIMEAVMAATDRNTSMRLISATSFMLEIVGCTTGSQTS